MRRVGFMVGRLTVWLWAGSWSVFDRVPCAHCHNLYIGPIGVEWERRTIDCTCDHDHGLSDTQCEFCYWCRN